MHILYTQVLLKFLIAVITPIILSKRDSGKKEECNVIRNWRRDNRTGR